MKRGEQDFLDPAHTHKLSEQECELIAYFRTLKKGQRESVMKALFAVLMRDEGLKRGSDK